MLPSVLYHGSTRKIDGPLQPVLINGSEDRVHNEPIVFATDNAALAGLFMAPTDALVSIGFEQDIAYICIWGTPEEFAAKDRGGYLYFLPGNAFEKRGKGYEWQSRTTVTPQEIKFFPSVLKAWKELGVRVYFINDDHLFDLIQTHKENRLGILKDVRPFDDEDDR
jgi:hypothetical protein